MHNVYNETAQPWRDGGGVKVLGGIFAFYKMISTDVRRWFDIQQSWGGRIADMESESLTEEQIM